MIFYLLGKSGSGKDTILKELLKDEKLSLNPITLYTTRPIRPGEEEGREYYFITDEKAMELEQSDRLIEMRTYNTAYGPWKYMSYDNISTTDADGEKILPERNFITIGTLESYVKYVNYYGAKNTIPVYVTADMDTRRERSHFRLNGTLSELELKEIDRRLKADEEDFSDENLKKCSISSSFDNSGKLEDCVNEVKNYIREKIKDTE